MAAGWSADGPGFRSFNFQPSLFTFQPPMPDWVATYRLQLHAGFPLPAAEKLLPYLVQLGVSHVYLSPCLQARTGSTHGYDMTDPGRISEERGGEAGWSQFCAAARTQGLGVLLDIVSNHMAVSAEN